MNPAQRKPTGQANIPSILGITAALLVIAAAAALTAAVIAGPEAVGTVNRPDTIPRIGGALIWTALAGSIVKTAATGWRDTPSPPRNALSRAARAAGAAAAIIVFSLGAAMLLHPRMFQ